MLRSVASDAWYFVGYAVSSTDNWDDEGESGGECVLKTTFSISKIDCPSEELMIRMKLEGITNIQFLQFDIPSRKLDPLKVTQALFLLIAKNNSFT